MQKILRYLVMTLVAVCCCLPAFASEAARVAALPLINNVEGDTIVSQSYYNEVIKSLKYQPGFVYVNGKETKAAIEAVELGKELPAPAVLAEVAAKGGADIVFAMQLDKLSDTVLDNSQDRMLQLDMKGKAMAYNALTGKVYMHEFSSDKQIDEALTARWDWLHEEFARTVRVELQRALKSKK